MTATTVDLNSVSARSYVSCGLTTGGEAFCWGGNADGSLGAGFSGGAALPVRVAGSLSFKQIVAGLTSCGLTLDGSTYCWGRAGNGLFTPDTTVEVNGFPRPVRAAAGFSFAELTLGSSHACGLTTAGQAYCWGWGHLGSGNTPSAPVATPVPVGGGLAFTSLSAGGSLTCGTVASGAAWCWGENRFGQLGNADTTVHLAATPVQVAGGLAFTQVSVGHRHACGLVASGAAYCWGRNGSGEWGTTTTEVCVPESATFIPCSSSPVPVAGDLAFRVIASGTYRTCGLALDGKAYCLATPSPVAVPTTLRFSNISVGDSHICGLGEDGIVYCWGDNSSLQLGVPTLAASEEPVAVAGQE